MRQIIDENAGSPHKEHLFVSGQSGHAVVPDKESNVAENKVHLFNLKGQLSHKLDLLTNHIDKKSKLHLIGHSIGAWLVVEILQNNEALFERVSSINLLFPTLQRMAKTRNGKFLNVFVRRIHLIIILLLSFLNILPECIKIFLVGMYLKLISQPSTYCKTILKYLYPKVIEKVLILAYDEMDKVTMLNKRAIEKIKHLTNVIYSTDDGWAPLNYIDELKMFQPSIQMQEVNIEHAFVFKSSEQVAEMVVKFIKTKMSF